MTIRQFTAAALGGFMLVALASGAAQAQNKCASSKMKAAAKKATCLLGLESKEASSGTAPAPAKVQKCRDKLSSSFSKLEGKGGCVTTGDAQDIEDKVDAFVADVDDELAPGSPNKCQGAKIKAAGKKAQCLLGLEAKEVATGSPKDPAKVQKCMDKFSSTFSKSEAKGGCATTGDTQDIEDKVDAFVEDADCELGGGPACDCGTPDPATLRFRNITTAPATCGAVLDDSGATLVNLDCGDLNIGGSGTAVPPAVTPDNGTQNYNITSCCGKKMRLAATTPAETGSIRTCSGVGCLFGAPLPIVSATSTCVINEVSTDGAGTAQCDTGESNIDLPLASIVNLTLDILPNRCSAGSDNPGESCTGDPDCPNGTCDVDADTQPCPICNPTTLVCNGGPNDGLACTPGTVGSTGPQFPTSHDCPPGGPVIGTLPIAFALTTGTASRTAVDNPSQSFVVCGFCGSPTGSGPGFKNPAVPCTTNADCAGITTGCPPMLMGPCTACRQRNPGAFAQGPARTVTETGSPAGPIATGGAPAASTVVSAFCIPPTYNAAIDSSADLPGPGAVALPGEVQLLP
jgi:hypothetical protein